MTNTQSIVFANRGVIYADYGGTAIPTTQLGVVKDVEITVSAEHVPLYGWGSIARQGVAKHSLKIPVKVGYVKWNPYVATGATPFPMGIFGGTTVGWGASDTNVVPLFAIKAVFTFEDGQVLTGTIHNIFFPDLPLKASEGQWVRIDVSGEGATASWAIV
jgi:hypothetical protein